MRDTLRIGNDLSRAKEALNDHHLGPQKTCREGSKRFIVDDHCRNSALTSQESYRVLARQSHSKAGWTLESLPEGQGGG